MFRGSPRICRLILAVYEDDLRQPQFLPSGGYRLNLDCVIKRLTYQQTHGENGDLGVAGAPKLQRFSGLKEKMFKSALWRSEKNKIKFVFKLQFHATRGLLCYNGPKSLSTGFIPLRRVTDHPIVLPFDFFSTYGGEEPMLDGLEKALASQGFRNPLEKRLMFPSLQPLDESNGEMLKRLSDTEKDKMR
ncbi:unnamed protein product [Camellia sinensis]